MTSDSTGLGFNNHEIKDPWIQQIWIQQFCIQQAFDTTNNNKQVQQHLDSTTLGFNNTGIQQHKKNYKMIFFNTVGA